MNDSDRTTFRFRRPLIGLTLVVLSTGLVAVAIESPASGLPATPVSAATPVAIDSELTAPEGPAPARPRMNAPSSHRLIDASFKDRASAVAAIHHGLKNTPMAQAERQRTVAALEDGHRAEPIDAAWSTRSEVAISRAAGTAVMEAAGFKPRDVTTDCRSRTCRLSARFNSSVDARDWAQRLLVQMGGTIAQAKVTVLPQGDGSFEVRVYGVRRAS
jgi:hypothetical protein